MALSDAILTHHVLTQMARREISDRQVRDVLRSPEAVMPVGAGRVVAQAVLRVGESAGAYLFRVVVDIDREPPEVVTVYRTSKMKKYRSAP